MDFWGRTGGLSIVLPYLYVESRSGSDLAAVSGLSDIGFVVPPTERPFRILGMIASCNGAVVFWLIVRSPGIATRLRPRGESIQPALTVDYPAAGEAEKRCRRSCSGSKPSTWSCRGVGRNWCSGISGESRLSVYAARSMH
jgi:hypothetical protein